jgi:hypothetical protein
MPGIVFEAEAAIELDVFRAAGQGASFLEMHESASHSAAGAKESRFW